MPVHLFCFIFFTAGAARCDVCFIFMVSCQIGRRVVNIRASMFSVLHFISFSSSYLSQAGPLHHSVRREQVLLRKGESSKPLKAPVLFTYKHEYENIKKRRFSLVILSGKIQFKGYTPKVGHKRGKFAIEDGN